MIIIACHTSVVVTLVVIFEGVELLDVVLRVCSQ
jgi:hypothetical protein